jgi:hypothetical protein
MSEQADAGWKSRRFGVPGWPHLKVAGEWVALEILSDPFVRFANRRYLPTVEVELLDTGQRLIWYVAAQSVASVLESFRMARGSLTGLRIRVRREGTDQAAPYQIELLPADPEPPSPMQD